MLETTEAAPEYQGSGNTIIRKKNLLHWVLLAGIIAFVIFVRVRLLTTPLERDEGEYAYMGQLMLQGVPPYVEAFNMKLPGTSIMYAIVMFLFGQTSAAIHLGLLIANVISLLLIYVLTKKWFDVTAAIIAAASFGLLSLSPHILGFAAHATHFVIVFALGGMLILLHAFETKKRKPRAVFYSGIMFGLAFLMKQPGIFFFVFGLSMLGIHGLKEQYSQKNFYQIGIVITGGFLVPLLLLLLVIYAAGAFDRFWFWVVQYAFEYGSVVPLSQGMMNLTFMVSLLWSALPWFCILIGIGGLLIIVGKLLDSTKNMILSLGLFSFLALIPSLFFRYHYFIFILPVCSVFIGGGFSIMQQVIQRRPVWRTILLMVFVLLVGQNLYANRAYYFFLSPVDIVRSYYVNNYFAESIPISDFLIQHTAPHERIAVVGSEPQIFFYTQRRSVSGHIYMYGMMEHQPYARTMQEEFIADIERAQPNYLVCFWIPLSWFPNDQSDRHILDWVKHYTAKYYYRVGTVDLLSVSHVRYVWGDSARTYKPVSQDYIYIFERKGTDTTRIKMKEKTSD